MRACVVCRATFEPDSPFDWTCSSGCEEKLRATAAARASEQAALAEPFPEAEESEAEKARAALATGRGSAPTRAAALLAADPDADHDVFLEAARASIRAAQRLGPRPEARPAVELALFYLSVVIEKLDAADGDVRPADAVPDGIGGEG